jgi:hypothetical protein
MGKLKDLTAKLAKQTATATRNNNDICQILRDISECVEGGGDDVCDAATASGGVLDILAKNNVLEPGGKRGNDDIINIAWTIPKKIMFGLDNVEKDKARRHALIKYGWLELAARELDYCDKSGKILQSTLDVGISLWVLCDKEAHDAEMASSSLFGEIIPLAEKYKGATDPSSPEFNMLTNMFQCIYNSARWDPCREAYKAFPHIIPICDDLIQHPSKEIAIPAAFTICLLAGRDESGAGQDLLKRSPNIVTDTISLLDRVIDAGEGGAVDGSIWDPEEFTRILMNISISDANKPMLKPAIPVLIKAMNARSGNAKMNKEIIIIFMQLSFEPITMKILQGSVSSIETAIGQAKKEPEDVVQAAALMSRLKPEVVKQDRRASVARQSARIGGAAKQRQIMISYNWGSKETVLKINSALVQSKYKVWIDVEQMAGNIADKMAEAVEGSDAVLMCISSKYKESANCRQEAEYALECNKPLVILMMEKDYKANGWLGLIVGRKLWVDCTDPDAPDFAGVIREVSALGLTAGGAGGGASSGGGAAAPAAAAPAATVAHATAPKSSGGSVEEVRIIGNKAASMTVNEVVEWATAVKLSPRMIKTFKSKSVDGKTLLGMFLADRHGTSTMKDIVYDFGCASSIEGYKFLYELEVLLQSKNA